MTALINAGLAVAPVETAHVLLSSVARIVSGGTPKTGEAAFWNGDIPWATPKDLSGLESVEIHSTPRLITDAGLRSSSAELLPVNSVLFSSRAPIGLLAINTTPMATNQGFKSFVPDPERLDSRYLFRWLEANRARLQNMGVGATFKEVSKAILSRLVIPLPPIDEQRRIAAILDRADALRSKRRQALLELNALTDSMFDSIFGDLENWKAVSFHELCHGDLRNGVSPSTGGTVTQQVLTLSSVTGQAFEAGAVKTGLFDKDTPIEQRVSSTALLICRGNGNINLVGRGHFPPADNESVVFPDTIIAAKPSLTRVTRGYLGHLWNTPYIRRQISSRARTTNGTYKVNQASLGQVLIPEPPMPLQQDFSAKLESVNRLRKNYRAQVTEFDALFASLQHWAFGGDLR